MADLVQKEHALFVLFEDDIKCVLLLFESKLQVLEPGGILPMLIAEHVDAVDDLEDCVKQKDIFRDVHVHVVQ